MTATRIPRMRTVAKIVAEIKALDPKSDVTDYCVRQLVKTGAVPAVWTGNKVLINLDDILELFRIGTGPTPTQEPVIEEGIRKINV